MILWLAAVVAALGFGISGLVRMRPYSSRRHAQPCPRNLKSIWYACKLYADENGGSFPPRLDTLGTRYCGGTYRVFICEGVKRHFEPYAGPDTDRIPAKHMTYCYVSGLRASDKDRPWWVLAFEEEWNHGGRGAYVLRTSGNVEWRNDIDAVHKELRDQLGVLRGRGRDVRILRPSWSRFPDRPGYWHRALRRAISGFSAAFVLVSVGLAAFIVARRRASGRPPHVNQPP